MAVLTFKLDYHTTWGQQVCLCGSLPALGGLDETNAPTLSNEDGSWFTEIDVDASCDLTYYYFIREDNRVIRREWGNHRMLRVTTGKDYIIRDFWKEKPYHGYLYSSAFTESVFFHQKKALPKRYHAHSVLIHVVCPYVKSNQTLVISGECEGLGEWDVKRAKSLNYIADGEWQLLLNAKKIPERSAYKFVIIDKATREAVHWEEGGNRILEPAGANDIPSVFVETGLNYHYPNFTFNGIGTAVPLFSLKTNESFGIGDFADLRKMVDWVAITGQQLIQLLPVNDTTTTKTWRDSYPYSAISNYALHPIYLGCNDFPLKDKKISRALLKEAKQLNKLSQVDYEKVLTLKEKYIRELFRQEGETVLVSEPFKTFYKQNEAWLFPYACYCYLRDRNRSANFSKWKKFRNYDEAKLKKMLGADPEAAQETRFWYFIQFLLHQQFSGIKKYAHEKGIILKGDIPIGINRNSVEAWTTPHLFNMDTQTGAPPDDFSYFGQNWGFPTYNWKAMKEEGYAWWINRFQKMEDYFDAYRIDHILGFFRIWEIPIDAVQGLLGYFNPALPYGVEELVQAGIPFTEERMVQPFIHEQFLPDLFGEDTEEIKRTYLNDLGWQRFRLKPFCDTQQKINKLFEEQHQLAEEQHNVETEKVREGLLYLCSEVLFVRDPHDRNRFHPRITAQYTFSYRYLEDHVKEAFNRLYDDFFYHRHNNFWRDQAMKKLPAIISATSMMACGEDLGMVPDCVPSVMDELQILSLEIQRMPKKAQTTFSKLHCLPYLSVCTTSTHDMSPLRLWWTENRELTQRYYNEVLRREGGVPEECSADICRQIIEEHLRSPAMWVILPWQDWLSIDEKLRDPDFRSERINVPANPEHYWRYRMHISLDSLLEESEFNEKIRETRR